MMSTSYRIVIRGRPAERYLREYRDEFVITTTDTYTVLEGLIRDPAQLHGLVAHLTKVGLELVELSCLDYAYGQGGGQQAEARRQGPDRPRRRA